MITINYSGQNEIVILSVQKANQLLLDPNFYGQIESHPNFELSDATPAQVSSILRNSNFQMTVAFYKPINPFSRALAYDSPSEPLVIHLNKKRLNRSVASICATIIHECVHAADSMEDQFSFGHGDNSSVNKDNTAPYWIDQLAYKMISGLQTNSLVFHHDLMSNDTA